jgi:hypothetical protein
MFGREVLMPDCEQFDCCDSRTCKASTAIKIIDLCAMGNDYNTITITATRYAKAYTVIVEQSNNPNFVGSQSQTISVPAAPGADVVQDILINLRYIRISIVEPNVQFKVCYKLRTCCEGSVELTDLEQDVDDILSIVQGSQNSYYEDDAGTALTNAFAEQLYGFTSSSFDLSNDDKTNYIEWSWDGVTVAGRLYKGETFHESQRRASIYLRGQAGGESYRVLSR